MESGIAKLAVLLIKGTKEADTGLGNVWLGLVVTSSNLLVGPLLSSTNTASSSKSLCVGVNGLGKISFGMIVASSSNAIGSGLTMMRVAG
jgi:hypothetical protein